MGSADWLRMYARQLEDQHAPSNLSIGMREAADQMDQQRETTLQLLGQVGQLSDEIERLKDGEARLRARVVELEGQHKGLVLQNAILRQRPDLPVDRIPAADEIERLRAALEEIVIHCDWPDRVEKYARAVLEEK